MYFLNTVFVYLLSGLIDPLVMVLGFLIGALTRKFGDALVVGVSGFIALHLIVSYISPDLNHEGPLLVPCQTAAGLLYVSFVWWIMAFRRKRKHQDNEAYKSSPILVLTFLLVLISVFAFSAYKEVLYEESKAAAQSHASIGNSNPPPLPPLNLDDYGSTGPVTRHTDPK